MAIPVRQFKDGVTVSAIGIGGSSLGDIGNPHEVDQVVNEAIDAGVTFFDNAWEYHDGMCEELLGRALAGKRDKVFLMSKVCTHGRDAQLGMKMLEDSLRRLQTDHLDLWQIHEVIYDNDPDLHFAQGGVIEAITKAKQQGKVKYVGFTGHKDPFIHLKMLRHEYPFDTVQMPLNVLDGAYEGHSFEREVVPEVRKRGMHVIGMKSMGGGGEPIKHQVYSPQEALRYAMSLPVLTTVSGIDSLDILRQNLAIAENFVPMTPAEMDALRKRSAFPATDGRYELYKTTKVYDAAVGRMTHKYPPIDELPA